MQKAAENRVRTLVRMSRNLRAFRRKFHATFHMTGTGGVPICFAARCVLCQSNPVRKKFHVTVVVSCCELMCGQSPRQASSAMFAVHSQMQEKQTLTFS